MENNNWYLYRHLKPCGEVFYIGIGNTAKYKRAYENGVRRSVYWQNKVKKYPNYEIQILTKGLTKAEASGIEVDLIAWYGRENLGLGTLVNLTDGGEGIVGYKHSKEQLTIMSERQRGELNHFYGKTFTQEHRDKISNSNKGKEISTEIRQKTSNTLKGHVVSQITRNRISDTLKTSNPKGLKVIDIESLKISNSVRSAALLYGYNPRTLSQYLNGELKNKTNLAYLSEYVKQNPDFKHE
jgi:hypothetical protein